MSIGDALNDYIESEQRRWKETKELGPIGTFRRDFQFGLTGPAPSLQPNEDNPLAPKIDYGPPAFNPVNREAYTTISGGESAPGNITDTPAGNRVWVVRAVVAVAAIWLLGQLFEVHVGA